MLSNSKAPNPIVGSSVHNVCIEQLWKDTFQCILSVFYQLIQFLESEGKLDSVRIEPLLPTLCVPS